MDVLYSQIETLEQDLADDEHALHWFDITPPPTTSAQSEFQSSPLPGMQFSFYLVLQLKTTKRYLISFKTSSKVSAMYSIAKGEANTSLQEV